MEKSIIMSESKTNKVHAYLNTDQSGLSICGLKDKNEKNVLESVSPEAASYFMRNDVGIKYVCATCLQCLDKMNSGGK